MYGLKSDRRADYLDWFHQVHIQEKLARPGYTWAAHYKVQDGGNDTPSGDGDTAYIALFGGTDASVFYNPSPAQMALTQPAETRDMMGCRTNSRKLILAEEWSANGQGVVGDNSPVIDADVISIALCDVAGNDEDFGAWLVQDHLKSISQDLGCNGMRKFLASTGRARHAVIHDRSEMPTSEAFVNAKSKEWSANAKEYVTYPMGLPQNARRMWPIPS